MKARILPSVQEGKRLPDDGRPYFYQEQVDRFTEKIKGPIQLLKRFSELSHAGSLAVEKALKDTQPVNKARPPRMISLDEIRGFALDGLFLQAKQEIPYETGTYDSLLNRISSGANSIITTGDMIFFDSFKLTSQPSAKAVVVMEIDNFVEGLYPGLDPEITQTNRPANGNSGQLNDPHLRFTRYRRVLINPKEQTIGLVDPLGDEIEITYDIGFKFVGEVKVKL